MRAKRTLVAYAAAADGKDRNNPYTSALLSTVVNMHPNRSPCAVSGA